MHDSEDVQVQADRLDAAWDAASDRHSIDASVVDPRLTVEVRRIQAGLAAPEPEPTFLLALRSDLMGTPQREREVAASSRLGLVATPALAPPRVHPVFGRVAAVAALLAVVFGVALAVGWPADDGGAPLVASALASSEAVSPTANPTSTALLTVTGLRTISVPVSLWEAPAVGTPQAALSPSTPVELLGETSGRQGERWLRIRAADGAVGWVRAQDVVAGER